MKNNNALNYNKISQELQQNAIIAYPTEAVFGLGCDPDNQQAVEKLLAIKQRVWQKGLILIAANYQQFAHYIDETKLTPACRQEILATWPDAITWVMPAKKEVAYWLKGEFDSIAVRVTNHPIVINICLAFGKPLVSTSANLSGRPPCKTYQEVQQQFGNSVTLIKGKIGNYTKPTMIRDALTGNILREG